MYITFARPDLFSLSIGALLVGFILSQIGIYFTNRWGRRPRPDEHLDQALKGLNKQYKLFHYETPASHLLVGPAGVWVLLPKNQRGTITYQKKRWRQKGGGLLLSYLKIFAQEGLGRPDLEIQSETEAVNRFLEDKLADSEVPPIRAALVFTHPDVEVEADDAPVPTLHALKLKDFIRKTAKSDPLSMEKVKTINDTLLSSA
ncbi:MAG: hypothetical protein PVG14_04815 [Anaerolineales bacterium]|jgi:hypothetical protein